MTAFIIAIVLVILLWLCLRQMKLSLRTYNWLNTGVAALALTWTLLGRVPKEQPLWGILAMIVWPGVFLWDAIQKRKRELIIPAAITVALMVIAISLVIYQRA